MNAGETLAYGFVSVGVEPEACLHKSGCVAASRSGWTYTCRSNTRHRFSRIECTLCL